jgi:hypothetical protein
MRDIVTTRRSGLRWQLSVERPFGFSFKSRVEHTLYREEKVARQGFMAFADVRYRPMESPYSLMFRLCLFDTEGYDARIYAYENDVPYSHSMSALYGSGARAYLMARRRLGKEGHVALRISGTGIRPAEGPAVSSSGSVSLDLKIQVTWEF